MKDSIMTTIQVWNRTKSERAKLQAAYLTAAVIVLIVAGIIGLINYSLGQSILFVALFLVIVFIANAVSWALLDSLVVQRIKSARKK